MTVSEFYIVTYTVPFSKQAMCKLFRDEEKACSFVTELQKAYEHLGVDWDERITTHGASINDHPSAGGAGRRGSDDARGNK